MPDGQAERVSDGEAGRIEKNVRSDSQPQSDRQLYLIYGFLFKIRGLLALPLLFVMGLTTRWEWGNTLLNCALGLTLFAAAFVLRVRAQQYLRYRVREGAALTTGGPYCYVRNPVYLANIAAVAGLCILCRLYWLAPLAAAWAALIYHLAVLFEEMRLTARFGAAYSQYCSLVPRWWPRGTPGIAATDARVSVWKAVRVEWHDLLLLLVPVAKEWGLRPHAGKVHAFIDEVLSFSGLHWHLLAGGLMIGIFALAALNLRQLRRFAAVNSRSRAALASCRSGRLPAGPTRMQLW